MNEACKGDVLKTTDSKPVPGPMLESQRFSDLVHTIQKAAQSAPLDLQGLLTLVGPKGHAFACMFVCLPFMQPIPLPGLSTPFGIVLILVGALMMRGRPPRLPERLGRIRLETQLVLKICSTLEKILNRLEHLVKPRAQWLCRKNGLRILNGGLFCLNGFLLSLPLPVPFSNNLPAITIFMISWGTVEEDAVVIGLGHLMALVTLAFFAAIAVVPYLASIKLLES